MKSLGLRTLAFALAPMMIACGGETVDTSDVDDDTDDDTVRERFFEPDFAIMSGLFGYDSVNNQARSYLLPDGTEMSIFFEIELLNDAQYDPNDPETYCLIQFVDTALTAPASWLAAADGQADRSVAFGFSLPDSVQIGTTCDEMNFDPAVWGSAENAVDTITSWGWGMGIGTLDPDIGSGLEGAVVGQLDQATWDAEWEPYIFGGGVYWSALDAVGAPYSGGYADLQYARGFELDENFTLSYDDANNNGVADDDEDLIPLTATDVLDGTVPTGAYSIQAWYGLSATCLLGLESCP